MKKLLALVLALVMTMALAVTSNAAFKDADSIDYKEAVDVMNAVGVFIGDEKGNFNAKENLTREQAAKIIAYLELGEKAADALVGSATFTDVAATRWSAGFVSYCAQAGVVSGNGDGTFSPAGQLTALQFGKMLLVEIGYDAKAAGMTGTDWAINTSKLMATTGLMNGIDGSVNQVLTREKAAQMCLNALKTPTVEYATKGSNITVNGAEINFGASVPTYVTNTVAKDQTISNEQLTNSKEYTIELGEKLFKKLVLENDTTDAFGRPTHTWKLATSKIGEYADEATLTYTKKVELGDIYADLGLSKTTKVDEFYIDGKETDLPTLIKKDDHNLTGSNNGVLTQVFYDEDANDGKGEIIITEINTYVGEIGSVVKATSSADRYVNVTKASNGKNPGTLNTKFETENFAKGDLVTYTAAYNESTKKYDVQTVANLEKSFSGVLTAWKGTSVVDDDKGASNSNFTVDGTKYEYSAQAGIATADGFNNWQPDDIASFDVNKSEINVYLDEYGYAIYVTGVEGTKNYAAVIGIGNTNAYGSETKGVTLLLPDGTKKEVTAKLASGYDWDDFKGVADNADPGEGENNSNNATNVSTWGTAHKNVVTDGIGDVVSYSEEDGIYKLTPVSTTTYVALGKSNTEFTNGKSVIELQGDTYYTTSETVFFVATNKKVADYSDGVNYNVYTGYNEMPTLDKTRVYGISFKANDANQIDFIYIYASRTEGISGVDTYFVKEKDAKITTDSTGKYYVLPAIVDGEETEVKIDAQVVADFDLDGTADDDIVDAVGMFAIDNVVKNSKGIINGFDVQNKSIYEDVTKGTYGVGTVAASKVVLGIGSSKDAAVYWAYNNDTVVYVVDKDYKTITVSSVKDVATDANDLVFATINSAEKLLKEVVIIEQDDTTKSDDASITIKNVKGQALKASTETGVDYEVALSYAVNNGGAANIEYTLGNSNATVSYVGGTVLDATLGNGAAWTAHMKTGNSFGDPVSYVKVTVTSQDTTNHTDLVIKVVSEVAPLTLTTGTGITAVTNVTLPATTGSITVASGKAGELVDAIKAQLTDATGVCIKATNAYGTLSVVADDATVQNNNVLYATSAFGTEYTWTISIASATP